MIITPRLNALKFLWVASKISCAGFGVNLQIIKTGANSMGKRKRRGKLNWRSKRANKGRKPNLG